MTTSVAQRATTHEPPLRDRGLRGLRSPALFAAGQREAFCGMNLHVGRSRVAHVVAWVDWIDGLKLPVPACRQGFSGHGVHAELRPTVKHVSCRKCRRMAGHTGEPDPCAPCDPLLLF